MFNVSIPAPALVLRTARTAAIQATVNVLPEGCVA